MQIILPCSKLVPSVLLNVCESMLPYKQGAMNLLSVGMGGMQGEELTAALSRHSAERSTEVGLLSPLREQSAYEIAAGSIVAKCQAIRQGRTIIVTVSYSTAEYVPVCTYI